MIIVGSNNVVHKTTCPAITGTMPSIVVLTPRDFKGSRMMYDSSKAYLEGTILHRFDTNEKQQELEEEILKSIVRVLGDNYKRVTHEEKRNFNI